MGQRRAVRRPGGRSTVDGAIVVRGGECVGGGTTVNYALALDPVQAVWARWSAARGLTGFSFDPAAADYGVTGLNMASCLAEVKARINVHTPSDEEINDNNRVLERGCARVGLLVEAVPAEHAGVLGCGFCAEGCAYRSQAIDARHLRSGCRRRGVQLIHHCDVERLVFERRAGALTVTGAHARVRPTRAGSQPNSVEAGPLRHPRDRRSRLLADRSRVRRCCSAPATRTRRPDRARADSPSGSAHHRRHADAQTNYRGITGTVYSDHFYESHGFYYECLFGHPVYGAVVLPGIGPDHFDLMRKFDRLAGFGVMLVDTGGGANRVGGMRRVASARITLSPRGGGQGAHPLRRENSREHHVRSGRRRGVARVTGAARAPAVTTVSFASRGGRRRTASVRALSDADLVSPLPGHPQDGSESASSVVNARGESHQVRNLLVCDSSVFPESCGANPCSR